MFRKPLSKFALLVALACGVAPTSGANWPAPDNCCCEACCCPCPPPPVKMVVCLFASPSAVRDLRPATLTGACRRSFRRTDGRSPRPLVWFGKSKGRNAGVPPLGLLDPNSTRQEVIVLVLGLDPAPRGRLDRSREVDGHMANRVEDGGPGDGQSCESVVKSQNRSWLVPSWGGSCSHMPTEGSLKEEHTEPEVGPDYRTGPEAHTQTDRVQRGFETSMGR